VWQKHTIQWKTRTNEQYTWHKINRKNIISSDNILKQASINKRVFVYNQWSCIGNGYECPLSRSCICWVPRVGGKSWCRQWWRFLKFFPTAENFQQTFHTLIVCLSLIYARLVPRVLNSFIQLISQVGKVMPTIEGLTLLSSFKTIEYNFYGLAQI